MEPSRLPTCGPMEGLIAVLNDALGLLKESSHIGEIVRNADQSPASLLDQCLTLCAQRQVVKREPIRTVHHFACTGGTLMSKCIAAMPNIELLSEVDPLSTMQHQPGKPRFSPTDMVTLTRQSTQSTQSTREGDSELLIELFLSNLGIIYLRSTQSGQRLILRDHAHSHFCTGVEIPNRPSLRTIVASRFPVLSLVTVRHPIDNFLSLQSNSWLSFGPATFDEYCRRYVEFLYAYDGVPIVRYEDFVRAPQEIMSRICALLEIPFSEQFVDLFSVIKLTGDSGRGGNLIESKPRRPVIARPTDELSDSPNYRILCGILQYDDEELRPC